MRVGCVYWQDGMDHWHKQITWGQEDDCLSFDLSLYDLACRCGYHAATEKIFISDGGDWCLTIYDRYFSAARGVLDWYLASEYIWNCAKSMHADPAEANIWAEAALSRLYDTGGSGLL